MHVLHRANAQNCYFDAKLSFIAEICVDSHYEKNVFLHTAFWGWNILDMSGKMLNH